MPARRNALTSFLGRARTRARRREIGALAADSVLTAIGLGLAGAVISATTRRGDLAAAGTALALAAAAGAGTWRLRAAMRRHRDLLATARVIARHRGPLGAASPPGADADLRSEILGAAELAAGRAAHAGSPGLRDAYVDDVGHRVAHRDPARAVPRPAWRARVAAAAVLVALAAGFSLHPSAGPGLELLASARDGRPPSPPRPVWRELELTIVYPAHTDRPPRPVLNPTGALRVPAGTRLDLALHATQAAQAVRVVVVYDADELREPPPPELFDLERPDPRGAPLRWTGSVTVRGGGSWTVVLLDDEDDDPERAVRSPLLPLELEPDLAAEIDLRPLPAEQRRGSDEVPVEVRFSARDDFGLVAGSLVYQVGDGEIVKIPLEAPPPGARTWRHRHTWDLSAIPLEQRSDVTYWIEVRDDDPGLGLSPLPDPPGKVAESARHSLVVEDREREHARNVTSLLELRDAALDTLAARLVPSPSGAEGPLDPSRRIHRLAGELLASFAVLLDDLSVDTMVRERDVETFAGIHARLLALHRDEERLLARVPPGAESLRAARVAGLVRALAQHNGREVVQLEDDIIRLDDLVDAQIFARLERLLDRAETTLQKLVDLLEQHEAGDHSVRPRIDQLEQRLREDLRRIAETRAMLRKELGDEFMNLDALSALEERMRELELGTMLGQGQTGDALEQARKLAAEVGRLRGDVQERAADDPNLSEAERARLRLLRELSRFEDEQKALQAETRSLHDAWREAVAARPARDGRDAAERAGRLRANLEKINDARLSRDARTAFEDAREDLERLERRGADESASALELFETAQRAADRLERAARGSPADEPEGAALRRVRDRVAALRDRLAAPLPGPAQVLDEATLPAYERLREAQEDLRARQRTLMDEPVADHLPAPGRAATGGADAAMQRVSRALEGRDGQAALREQQDSLADLRRAIDSLRDRPPPPPAAPTGEASTEAERDRSWRDQLMDAMREGAPEGFSDPVERYYEELLR
jgi:hypothetical protein